jgi:excisionase family DNA binding protein
MDNSTNERPITEERWLRASAVAKILGLSKKTLNSLLNSGEIPAKKIGHHWRIPESGLREYLEKK